MMKKTNGKWRICIDFTNLNKMCLKDSYSLLRIDQMVNATSGHELLFFMDAFSGYNQIWTKSKDEEKITFIIEKGLYSYKVMPFGLKNIRATYQWLVNKVFKDQIDQNMEIYIDKILMKSDEATRHIYDLEEIFNTLRKH